MFRLVDFDSPAEKLAKMTEIKVALEGLLPQIDELHAIQVDFNCNPNEVYDLILTTELDSLSALDAYANHPAHQAIAKELIAPVKRDRACVDFSF